MWACPKALTFKNKPLPNVHSMEIRFEGTVATGKHAFYTSDEIPKECSEGFRDSTNGEGFLDPQCEPSTNSVDPMEVEGPTSSKERPTVYKGKGLASDVQLFRGICKKPRKKRSTMQQMSEFLKSMSDVIVESRSISTHNTPFRTTAANEMQAIMDMVLSLPGVQTGDRLHMFSTFFFMNNVDGRNMFAANVQRKEVQIRWLEKQYEMNPQFHVLSRKGAYLQPGLLLFMYPLPYVVIGLCLCTSCTLFFFCIGTNYMLAMAIYVKQWLLINCHLNVCLPVPFSYASVYNCHM